MLDAGSKERAFLSDVNVANAANVVIEHPTSSSSFHFPSDFLLVAAAISKWKIGNANIGLIDFISANMEIFRRADNIIIVP